MADKKVTVLGLGNILLRDEGVGVRVIERLKQTYELPDKLEIIDGGTMGLDLLPYLEGEDYLIVVDAVKSGREAGSIIRIEDNDIPSFLSTKLSPHQIGLSDLLATASLLDIVPEKIVLFGIEPKDMETGLELSDEVADKVDQLAALVASELRAIGIEIERRLEVAG